MFKNLTDDFKNYTDVMKERKSVMGTSQVPNIALFIPLCILSPVLA
jgi:hypothetical protein